MCTNLFWLHNAKSKQMHKICIAMFIILIKIEIKVKILLKNALKKK